MESLENMADKSAEWTWTNTPVDNIYALKAAVLVDGTPIGSKLI